MNCIPFQFKLQIRMNALSIQTFYILFYFQKKKKKLEILLLDQRKVRRRKKLLLLKGLLLSIDDWLYSFVCPWVFLLWKPKLYAFL